LVIKRHYKVAADLISVFVARHIRFQSTPGIAKSCARPASGTPGLRHHHGATVAQREPGRDQRVRAQDAAHGFPFSPISVFFETTTDPAREIIGGHADENMTIGPILFLMEVRAQSGGAFQNGIRERGVSLIIFLSL